MSRSPLRSGPSQEGGKAGRLRSPGAFGRPLALTALLLGAAPAAAQGQYLLADAESVFRIASEACLKGEAEKCTEGYERLVADGWASADLYYNLGTAYLRQGRLGWAVLYLERALRLAPGDDDIRANLAIAQRQRIDRLIGAPEEAGTEEPIASRVVSRTRADVWAVVFLAAWVVSGLLLLVRRWVRRPRTSLALLLAGLAALAAAIPSGLVLGAHIYVRERAVEGVVVAPSLSVREGPQQDLKTAFEIHEGLKVRVLDRFGDFKHVRLGNGLQGWVKADGVVDL